MRAGRRMLVWSGIPGEEALVDIRRAGKNQDYATFLRAEEPHPSRRDPPCEKYRLCGGCPMMHLRVSGQGPAKLGLLRSRLKAEGLGDICPDHLHAEESVGYRHVIKLVAGKSHIGRFRLGMRNKDGDLVPIPSCLVTTPALRRLMKQLAHLCKEMNIFAYEESRGTGLRHVVARQSRHSGKVHVTLVVGRNGGIWRELAEAVLSSSDEIVGIAMHINQEPGNAIFSRDEEGGIRVKGVGGPMVLEEQIGGFRFRIGSGDFFQNNPWVATTLQARAVEISKTFKGRPMVDLYCGVGLFTVALAKEHGWALGVEGLASAVLRAKENARLNRVLARFIHADVVDIAPQIRRKIGDASPFILVDPARRGLEAGVIESILSLKPAGILYVSCNPQSMSRDLRELIDRGWRVELFEAHDMFPQTSHMECISLLLPPEPPAAADWRPPRRVIL
jgi:23S rRNA (uracil1939-C5)-methyltransferase